MNAAAEVLPFPHARRTRVSRPAGARARWLPSNRSLAVGLLLLVLPGAAYLAARETSAFAVQTIEVRGGRADVAAQVRAALRSVVGSSLVSFDRGFAERRVLGIPQIASASFDRDFPHTLRVSVRLERGVALVRQGALAWLASSRARILRAIPARPFPLFPRVWVPRSVDVIVGSTLDGHPADAVRAVAPLAGSRFPGQVRSVVAGDGYLTLVLGSGTKVLLCDGGDLRLKLAVARRILPLSPGAAYVDVCVPERAVAGYNSQVGG